LHKGISAIVENLSILQNFVRGTRICVLQPQNLAFEIFCIRLACSLLEGVQKIQVMINNSFSFGWFQENKAKCCPIFY